MALVVGLLKRLFGDVGKPFTYEEARELAAHEDAKVRAEVAKRADVRPEILYFLSEDENSEVRRIVAVNPSSPPQANLRLATDADEHVRGDLAGKIAHLSAGLSAHEQDRLKRMTFEAIEILARDQIPRVRRILAETLKDIANAPPEVIRRLARDAELAVAAPVLQFSPVLTEEDLIEIISSNPVPGALSAISRRDGVNSRVADAIADTDDVDAIAVLLANDSAQIREETLDRLAGRAADIEAWHVPFVQRANLPGKAAQKLARFVAANLLQALADRNDLDPEAAKAVAAVVRKRLDEIEAEGPAKATAAREADETAALIRARDLAAKGMLDETAIDTALSGGDLAFVAAALSVLGQVSPAVVKKAITTKSAKGLVALAWKAKLSAALAVQIQTRLARVPSTRVIHPRGGDFALTPEDMEWQLEFLG